jgi:hypothetical protein
MTATKPTISSSSIRAATHPMFPLVCGRFGGFAARFSTAVTQRLGVRISCCMVLVADRRGEIFRYPEDHR